MDNLFFSVINQIKVLRRYDKNRGFNQFKSEFFYSYLVGLGIITIFGCTAWVFKDIFVLQTDRIILDILLRLVPCLCFPLLPLCKKNKAHAWIYTLVIVWVSIISNIILDSLVVPANGLTGEGWITYYIILFAISIVANKQLWIYASEIIYTILLIITAEDFGGPISYVTKVMRPITTGIIIDIGLILASATIRSAFIKLYENVLILRDIAKQDMLTGLWNRHKLDDLISEGKLHRISTVMILDIDKFKSINDTYGHMAGDKAIVFAANVLKKSCRKNDIIVRFGGDEFVIVLDGSIDTTIIWSKIEEQLKFDNNYNISFSAGSAKGDTDMMLYSLINKADEGAYYSKEHGRSRLTKYEDINNIEN